MTTFDSLFGEEEKPEEQAPERKGLLDTFREDGIGQGLAAMGGMMIPQSAMSGGEAGIGDIFSDFVEFSAIGDVKDVHSGIFDSELDPLERAMALLPLGGVALGATALTTGIYARRRAKKRTTERRALVVQQAAQERAALASEVQARASEVQAMESTLYPEGKATWDPAAPEAFGEIDMSDFDPNSKERREYAARLEQWAAENAAREGSYAPMHAADWDELGASVNEQYRKTAGVKRPTAQAGEGLVPALQVLGKKVVERVDEGTYTNDPNSDMPATIDEQQFIAAQWAVTRYMQGVEQGILTTKEGDSINTKEFLADLDGTNGPEAQGTRLHALLELETKMIKFSQGPDWTPTPQTHIETAFVDPETGAARIFVQANAALLPDQRIFDHEQNKPVDIDLFTKRNGKLNNEAITADMAANLILTYLEEQQTNPGRLQSSVTWYRRQNDVVRFMSEQTGHSVEQVAAYYTVLSQVTKWVPDNFIGATHMLIQNTRPDLTQGSPEYVALFNEAVAVGGWGEAMLDYTSKETKKAAERKGTPLTPENIGEYWADIGNATNQGGNLRGVDMDIKAESLEMLNAGVPWQLFLRTSKYHNFGHGMIDPLMADLATIDTHSNNATMGMVYTTLLGSGSTTDLSMDWFREGNKWKAEGYGTKTTISAADLDEAARVLREKFDMSEAKIAKTIKRFRQVPGPTAEARYRAQQKAHLIARDYLGLDAGHQVQAGTWIPIQERKTWIQGWRSGIRDKKGKGNELFRTPLAVWDPTIMHHQEGNPRWQQTIVGMTRNATPKVIEAPPVKSLKRTYGGQQGIHMEAQADGTVAVWGEVNPTNQRVLRHLRPTGPEVKGFRQWVPRKAKGVRDVNQHVGLMAAQEAKDGLPMTSQVRTQPGIQHVAERPGNWFVFEVEDQATANQLVSEIHGLEHVFGTEQQQTGYQDQGIPRQRLGVEHLNQAGANMTDPKQSPLLTNDWVAISAYTPDASDSVNLQKHHELIQELEKKGYKVIESDSHYTYDDVGESPDFDWDEITVEGSEKSLVVFGMDYDTAHKIGNKYSQESVMTREGLIYNDGTVDKATGEVIFGEAALNEDFYSSIDVGGRTVHYSFALSGDRVKTDAAPNAIQGQSARKGSRVQVLVNVGGVDAGVPTQHIDAVWNLGNRNKSVVSASAYTQGDLYRPPGTLPASEHVFQDGARVASVRTGAELDVKNPSAFEVHVPAHEYRQLSTETNPAGSSRRTMAQAMELRVEDVANNQIHIDGDVTLVYPPDSKIDADPNQARVLGLKVNGKAPKRAIVDVRGDRHQILIGQEGVGPGQVELSLSAGRITSVRAWDTGDLYAADEALGLAGVTLSQMRFDSAIVGEQYAGDLGKEDLTKRIPFLSSGHISSEIAGTHEAKINTVGEAAVRDEKLSKEMEQWYGEGESVRLQLGNRIAPSQATRVRDIVLGLTVAEHPEFKAFTDVYGVIPPSLVTRMGDGVIAGKIQQGGQDADLVGGLTTVGAPDRFMAIALNEAAIVRDQNLDGRLHEALDNAMKYSNAGVKNGHNAIEATMVHEMGHMLDHSAQKHRVGAALIRRVKRTMSELGSDIEAVASQLSTYSTTNEHEFLAEAFAEVVYNPDAHPALKELVKDVMDGVYLLESSARTPADLVAVEQYWTGGSA